MSYFGIPIRNGVPIGLGAVASLGPRGLFAPSLLLNFTSGVLDSRVTFTRASTATYINSAGALTSAAINEARFDYNPTTLVPLGLLIEESRTNLVLNSATLVTQSVTVTGVAHTLSFYGTGTVVISGTGTGTLVGSGAFPTRSTLTFTPTVGVVILTVTGTVTQAQLEAGAFATSYIPTTTAQVTRAADNAVISTLTPWFNAAEGTLYVNSTVGFTIPASAFPVSATFNDGTVNNKIMLGYIASNASVFQIATGSVSQVALYPSVSTANRRTAGAYKVNDFAASTNGSTPLTDTLGTVPTVDRLKLGDQLTFNTLNGTISSIAYYPRRLSNAQLKTLTV